MTRNNIFTIMTMTIMMMVSVNTFAQGRGGNNSQMMNSNRGGNREMVMNNGDNQMNRGGQMNSSYRGSRNANGNQMMASSYSSDRMECGRGQMMNNRGMQRGNVVVCRGGMPRVDARGFVPGWEGRVMYRDGRWGYLRGADWYWYDTYFEPDFYFGRPLDYFRPHFIPVDGRVATGVAVGAAVGALITALCH